MTSSILNDLKKIDNIQLESSPAIKSIINGAMMLLPGAASVGYGVDAYKRIKQGDYTGAAIDAGAAAGSFVPKWWGGLLVQLVGDQALSMHDQSMMSEFLASLPKDADPDIVTCQLALNQLGEHITVDGKITPEFTELFSKHEQELAEI
jgi:hypothetical protein